MNTLNKKFKGPVVLIIRDGWGEAKPSEDNCVTLANTPIAKMLEQKYGYILMNASGEPVGLPNGQMGNSEVGHTNIGAGRVVYQSLTLIDKAIKEHEFEKNANLLKAIQIAKQKNSALHILGLVSDGGVHSHINHIIKLNEIAKANGISKVYVHAFIDGRDVDPTSAKKYLEQLNKHHINIASVSGRYYAMDRDQRWERVQLAFDAIVNAKGNHFSNVNDYIDSEYKNNRTDEFIVPAFNQSSNVKVHSDDVIIFANFRPDRTRELSHLLIGTNIYQHQTFKVVPHSHFFTMMKYDGVECETLFKEQVLNNLLGDMLENHGLRQMRAAETEKYPHVTFFMDGGVEYKRKNEIRILEASPKVATYDLQPEMSARPLTERILKEIGNVDAAIINFANPDMVGHTAVIPAVVKSVEVTDEMVGKIYNKVVNELHGVLIVMADHGNAEKTRENGKPYTAHTTNPVKFIITSKDVHFKDEFTSHTNIKAKLGDVAPTMLKLLGIDKPKEMTGDILIK